MALPTSNHLTHSSLPATPLRRRLGACATLALCALAMPLAGITPRPAHAQAVVQSPPQALHGGVLASAGELEAELVATPNLMRLYVRSAGKPVDLAHAHARLTLASGIDRQEVALRPAGDRLEAAGLFQIQPGTTVVALVGDPARAPATLRFVLP